MDFSKFLSSDFDAISWINAALANSDSTNVEQSSNTLILKLQMSMQEVSNTVEEHCTGVTQQLPRLLREVDTVKQEALLLQHQMNEVRREVELCEQNTANSMRSIVAVDRLKTRMQAARKALEDADNWQLLSNELEDLFAAAKSSDSGTFDMDINASFNGAESSNVKGQIISKLTKMRMALNALAHVANYAERAAYFDKLASRFESIVRDELRVAISKRDATICARWHAAFSRIERTAYFRTLFLENECDTLLRCVAAAWNENKQVEGIIEGDAFQKNLATFSRFVITVLRTVERDGYVENYNFISTVFSEEAAQLELELVERCVANAFLSSSDALFVRTLRSLSEAARSSRRSLEYLEALVSAKRQLDTFSIELRRFLLANARLSDDSSAMVSLRERFCQMDCLCVSLLFSNDSRSRHYLESLETLVATVLSERIDSLALEASQKTSSSDELTSSVDWFASLARTDWFAFSRRLFSNTLTLGDAYFVPRFFSQLSSSWPKLLEELTRLLTNRFEKHRSRSLAFLRAGGTPTSAVLGDAEYQATLGAFACALQVNAAFSELLIELFRFVAFCAHILVEKNVPKRIQGDEFQCVTSASVGGDSVRGAERRSETGWRSSSSTCAFAFASADEKQTCMAFLRKLLRIYGSVSGETDMLNLVSMETRPKTIRAMRSTLQQHAVTFQNSTAFELPATVVRRSLAALPAAVREADSQSSLVGDLPLFSFTPSACVTQLGEFLMLIPQTLDLHTSATLCITSECREPHLVVLVSLIGQLPFRLQTASLFDQDASPVAVPHARTDSGSRARLESGSQAPVSPKSNRERTISTRERHTSVNDYSPSSGNATLHQLAIQFVNAWLESVVRYSLARACDELFENIRSLSERSTKQLLVDLNYLLNVADDLGVQRAAELGSQEKPERVDIVQRALQLSLPELAENERSCSDAESHNVLATVLRMRTAGAGAGATAANASASGSSNVAIASSSTTR